MTQAIDQGNVVAVCGPQGEGKSTVLQLVGQAPLPLRAVLVAPFSRCKGKGNVYDGLAGYIIGYKEYWSSPTTKMQKLLVSRRLLPAAPGPLRRCSCRTEGRSSCRRTCACCTSRARCTS